MKDQKKTKGKARIEAMLREKRPLKVYTIKKEDCPEFAKQAKGYGILYAPIPVKKGDDTIDILVFEDDAARANRIVEKFKLTVVDTASIKEDIEKSREQRGSEPAAPEQAMPEKSEDDQLLDELMESPPRKKAQPKIRQRRRTPLLPQRRKNPSVRAYLREQQQVRKGYF
ncbi:MAG: PcfB family protein [Oscillospiraceae bacterium]